MELEVFREAQKLEGEISQLKTSHSNIQSGTFLQSIVEVSHLPEDIWEIVKGLLFEGVGQAIEEKETKLEEILKHDSLEPPMDLQSSQG